MKIQKIRELSLLLLFCAAASTPYIHADCDDIPSPVSMNVQGEISIVMGHDENDDMFQRQEVLNYYLTQQSNEDQDKDINIRINTDLRLVDPTLVSGDQVIMPLTFQALDINSSTNTRRLMQAYELPLIVGNIANLTGNITKLSSGGGKDFIIGDRPLNMSSLTILMGVCDKVPNVNVDFVINQYFGQQVGTLKRLHETCSYNKFRFTRENNIVVGVVNMPCTGRTNVGAYDFSRCGDPEIYGLWEFAMDWLKVNRPDIRLREFKRKVMLIAGIDKCPWSGLGNVGCGGGHCLAWINVPTNRQSINMGTIYHELGHNIGLQHSSRLERTGRKNEYGDPSCPLGHGFSRDDNNIVCLNGPHSYKAGWSHILHDIKLSDVPIGRFISYEIPPLSLNDRNLLRINVQPGSEFLQRALFVSFRAQNKETSFDTGLDDRLKNRVYIYEFNGTQNGSPDNLDQDPLLLMMFDDTSRPLSTTQNYNGLVKSIFNETYRYGNIIIRLAKYDSRCAHIEICRYSSTTERVTSDSCDDGIDNDCDGFIDMNDSDCSNRLSSPPPTIRIVSPPPPFTPRLSPSPPPKQLNSPPPKRPKRLKAPPPQPYAICPTTCRCTC